MNREDGQKMFRPEPDLFIFLTVSPFFVGLTPKKSPTVIDRGKQIFYLFFMEQNF